MLSYQHSFHAGNHADVIKHLCLIALIKNFHKKPKPFFYLDTHAGNGAYSTVAAKNKDTVLAQSVCEHVLTDAVAQTQDNITLDSSRSIIEDNDLLSVYSNIIAPYLAKDVYLGSPLIAAQAISYFSAKIDEAKSANNLQLSEMHPQAFDELKEWIGKSEFSIHKRDGFELFNALVPPKPNRGLVLIDPPYEQAQEYDTVVSSITKALAKWPQGIIALWFPLLSPKRIDRQSGELVDNPKSGLSETMIENLASLAEQHKLGALELRFVPKAPSEQVGMYGSGMFVINPPWQFSANIDESLNTLFTQFSDVKSQHLSYTKTWRESE